MTTTLVKLPNGRKLTAVVGEVSEKGYRTARVKIRTAGEQLTISGRISTRHGLDRTLPFEVNMDGVNATAAFQGEDTVYAK